MAITLMLREEAGQLVVKTDDRTVKTALDILPAIDRLQADPFTHGRTLTEALGGETNLLGRLQNDPDNLILLDCDDKADSFAWEFATCTDGQFLCVKAGMLRTVDRDAPPIAGNGALNFVALAADPLVDEQGNPREGYRLDLDNEMKAIRATLLKCGKNLEAKRIPPTREKLYEALRKGPAILHLSCHGNVVETDKGSMAILLLEKKDGSSDPFAGSDLMNTKRGILRMVMLSACKTATGSEANLARALALNGVPMTVGMQESISDKLSDEVATAFYDSLLNDFTFGQALQQARQNILQYPESVGLLVGYVAKSAWQETLPLKKGTPSVGSLGKPGIAMLGGEIQPPRPLLGRNLELHQLAKLFAGGEKVITVAGTGGMGKTALAATFAERFAWMWLQGVRAYSFANEVNFASFVGALLRILYGNEAASQAAALTDNEKRQLVLGGVGQWDGLWLFDNYESIMQGLQESDAEAECIHRLIADLANGGAALLLTSREQPAGLRNEKLFPEGRHLAGLRAEAGVTLFFQHSTKANPKQQEDAEFAFKIQQAAKGHPLAIALLAGEYDTSPVPQKDFLDNWTDELAAAKRAGLAGHHVTFTTAFERSYSHLSASLKLALTSLSIFPFPFFANALAFMSPSVIASDSEAISSPNEETASRQIAATETLNELARRSLLEVEGKFPDGSPATYRFQPALRQEAARRLDQAQKETQRKGYAAYGAWLANRGYGDIHSDIGLNRVVRLSMDAMEKATDSLQGAERLWHIRRLAWLKNAWGEVHEAFNLLNSVVSESQPDPAADPEDAKVQSSIRYELAGIYITRGDLDRALQLYEESLALKEQLGDKQGKAASLSNMAQVFLTRGDLDRALQLYEESLKLDEQLGDKQGKAASLSSMSNVYWEKKDYTRAQVLMEQAIELRKQVGDLQGIAYDIIKLGQLCEVRGDKETALTRYHEGLALFERLGAKPLIAQVKQLIAGLESGTSPSPAGRGESDPLAQTISQARSAAERGDIPSAIQFQEQVVEIARQYGQERESLATLSVMLYNLAGYYGNAERFDDAVKVMQEVVAIDEKIGRQDLESDREMLEAFRRIASMSPEERQQLQKHQAESRTSNNGSRISNNEEPDFETQLQAQLAGLPPEKRAEVEAQIRKAYEEFQHMTPEEKAEKIRAAQVAEEANRRKRIDQVAIQVRDAALAYFHKQAPKRDVLNMLEESTAQMKANEKPGSPWLEVAALCIALVALIKEEPIPPVPVQYAAHFSAVQAEAKPKP